MSRVAVRLDASAEIGTGHWRRMSNLLDALRPEYVVFIVRSNAPRNPMFHHANVRFLQNGDEIAISTQICINESIDLLIIDLLIYPTGYLARLRAELTCRIVSFHEYRDWDVSSDLVINYNTFDGFADVSAPHVLAGPAYCILNPAILSLVGSPTSEEVLVTFGGADPSRFAESFIKEVAPRVPWIPFVLHLGPFSHQSASNLPANVRLSRPSESFFHLMATCRAAITAAGNAMYELIYLGNPALVVAHNSHQAEFATTAARMGAARYFGSAPKVDWAALASSLLDASVPPRLEPPLIDGLGLDRIVTRINQLAA